MPARRAHHEQVFRLGCQEQRQEPTKRNRMLTHPLQHSPQRRSSPWYVLSRTAARGDIQALQPGGLRRRAIGTRPLHPGGNLCLVPRQERHLNPQPRPVESQPVLGRLRPAETSILHQKGKRFRNGAAEALPWIGSTTHAAMLHHSDCHGKATTRRTYRH